MTNNRDLPILVLASASPRRKEILASISIPFVSEPVDIQEKFSSLPSENDAIRLAEEKVLALLKRNSGFSRKWILGCDTIVEESGRKLGKPDTREEAGDFIRRLSGKTHKVITGLALYSPLTGTGEGDQLLKKAEVTEVTFSVLSENEISWYLESEEWKGAAGGYRIQERGGLFVKRIQGSCSNVVGLPIHTFYGMVRSARYLNI